MVEKGGSEADGVVEGWTTDFLVDREGTDGPGGAHQAAQDAMVFAIADAIDEDRGPDPFPSPFQQGGLQDVGGTDAHAGCAFDAASGKIIFGKRSRGTDQRRMVEGDRRDGTAHERKHRHRTDGGFKQTPAVQVEGLMDAA